MVSLNRICGFFLMLGLVSGCGGDRLVGVIPVPASSPTGTVKGQVVSLAHGSPVSGATVKTKVGTTTTAVDGRFSVPAPPGDRTIVHVEANGFAEAFPVARVISRQATNLGVKLVPTGATTTVSVAEGDTVSVPHSPARVTIPANGLVPKAGGTSAETVTVSLTPINPAIDPNLMPGGFSGISIGGGAAQPIESFGALLVDIRDSAGTRYTLAEGKTSTIRIPLGTQSANPPATVSLWFLDETAGVWKEEGTATLQGTAPDRYYEGTVAHFRYWNADVTTEQIFVTGCVKDANGEPVANALVRTEGIDYTGVATGLTAEDGTFQVAMRQNSRAKLGLSEFDQQTFKFVLISNLVNVGPSATDIRRPNCLVKLPRPLTITTMVHPGGNVGAMYHQTLEAAGGVPGYVWSLNSGSHALPVGLALTETGTISGTPTAAGTTMITVNVIDSAGATATTEFALTIHAPGVQPLAITTAALPAGTVGTAYNATLMATGGTGAKSWSISFGVLPPGLALNPVSGVISGTPIRTGAFSCTIRVQDHGTPSQSDEIVFGTTINPASGDGGSLGTLSVTGAPTSVGRTFVADGSLTTTKFAGFTGGGINWNETRGVGIHVTTVTVSLDPAGRVGTVGFLYIDSGGSGGWGCGPAAGACHGVTINRTAGSAIFTNVVLRSANTNSPGDSSPITLNGMLTFTPF
ncbi:MAG: putative Ig domain-containing protein [Nitrospira sp.]|nr:putative Ig domain-containing protein [Nitrospira sp.]